MNSANKQSLKSKAHHLKPIVLIGSKGLTASVIEATNEALIAHELVKLRISHAEKKEKAHMVNALCNELQADIIQQIGNTATIYRPNDKTTSTMGNK